jgi:hypothetical protein
MTAPTQAAPIDAGEALATEPVPPRHAALMDAAARVRLRRRSFPIDRILLAAASILTPVGILLIILAWYGAAHTGKVYEQIDYLISGGLLGATLTVLGGFLYFGYWLTRQLQESRRDSALAMQAFRRLEDALTGAETLRRVGGSGDVSAGNGAAPPPPRAAPAKPAREVPTGELPVLVATPRGNLLHRPECAIVAHRPGTRPVAPGTEGYGYCRMCDAAGALT